MVEPEFGGALCHFQKLGFLCFSISHCVSVNGPCLSACPGGIVGESLTGLFVEYFPGFRVVVDYMIITVIFTELFPCGGDSVRVGYFCIMRVTGHFAGEIK